MRILLGIRLASSALGPPAVQKQMTPLSTQGCPHMLIGYTVKWNQPSHQQQQSKQKEGVRYGNHSAK